MRSRERDAAGRDVPLTPRHSAGLVGMWEREDVGRVGLELYYTGRSASKRTRMPTAASRT